jgi:hypothetical protein
LIESIDLTDNSRTNTVVYDLPLLKIPHHSDIVTMMGYDSFFGALSYTFFIDGMDQGELSMFILPENIYPMMASSYKEYLDNNAMLLGDDTTYGLTLNKQNNLIPYISGLMQRNYDDDLAHGINLPILVTDSYEAHSYNIFFLNKDDSSSVGTAIETFIDYLEIDGEQPFDDRGYAAYEGDDSFYRGEGAVNVENTQDEDDDMEQETSTTSDSTSTDEEFYTALIRAVSMDNAKQEICKIGYADTEKDSITFSDVESSTREGQSVQKMVDYCLVHGYGNDGERYGLHNYLKKGEAYKIFVRMLILDHTKYDNGEGHWAIPHYISGRPLGLWNGVDGAGMLDEFITLPDFMHIVENIVEALDRIDGKETAVIDYSQLDNRYVKRGLVADVIAMVLDRMYEDGKVDLGSFNPESSDDSSLDDEEDVFQDLRDDFSEDELDELLEGILDE